MRARRLDFARRPFRDERPVLLVAALAFAAAALLIAANVRQYRDFHREIGGTGRQIEFLQERLQKVSREAEQSRAELASFNVAALAQESRGLLRIVAERRFSWTGLLARLERTLPPEVRVTRLTPQFAKASCARSPPSRTIRPSTPSPCTPRRPRRRAFRKGVRSR